jgi:rod shape-determining protein MreD
MNDQPVKPLLLQGAELLVPPTPAKVYGSLLVALILSLLPWHDRLLWLVPDFVLMVLIYWAIFAPRRAGLGLAFLLGLLADVAHGALMGLNALAYCAAAMVTLAVSRRLEKFDVPRRSAQVAPILIGKELLLLLLGISFGQGQPDWRWLAAGATAALLWLPMAWLLDRLTGRPSHAGKDFI